uniref:R1-B73 n=1 Tax=Zea mays TaxID=4577 RepID=Q8S482_MAIZE|nr:r1-B73 [Zea mays]
MALSASRVQQAEELLQRPAERQLMRSQLAAAARSINWSYALFWSISDTQPGKGLSLFVCNDVARFYIQFS